MLEQIFGNTTIVRILESFLKKENRDRWMNLREVGRQSNIDSGTVSKMIDTLVKNRIISEESPSRRARIFKLNQENKYVHHLIKFYENLLKG
jgi:DNA-binding MarR family transcriptional regulator